MNANLDVRAVMIANYSGNGLGIVQPFARLGLSGGQ
jgi:hypothetical protein